MALVLARALESLLFEITVSDPMTFSAVPVVLAAVALVAAFLPARRAARSSGAMNSLTTWAVQFVSRSGSPASSSRESSRPAAMDPVGRW